MQSEGDWRHVMGNGPWQFEHHAIVLKEMKGNARPSEVELATLTVWVQFLDLPPGMMNEKYCHILGGWLGKVHGVDADKEGNALGDVLRVKVEIPIDQPLARAIQVKESKEDVIGVWYEVKYEKIPHFCFGCGKCRGNISDNRG
jgi:hypothetical protein